MSTTRQKVISNWFSQKNRDSVHVREMDRKEDEITLRASHNGQTFFVYLDLSGEGRHHCSCRDWPWGQFLWSLGKRSIICRHIVAAALQEGQAALLLPLLAP